MGWERGEGGSGGSRQAGAEHEKQAPCISSGLGDRILSYQELPSALPIAIDQKIARYGRPTAAVVSRRRKAFA